MHSHKEHSVVLLIIIIGGEDGSPFLFIDMISKKSQWIEQYFLKVVVMIGVT